MFNLKKFSISYQIEKKLENNLININELKFPIKSLQKFCALQIEGESQKKIQCYGLGVDINRKVALIKSYVEYTERSFFWDLAVDNGYKSTNGLAGHRFLHLARLAARAEIIERDSFLLHWFSKTPMEKIDGRVFNNDILPELNSEGIIPIFFKTNLTKFSTISCFLINKNSGGFAIGLSHGRGYKKDIEKALLEAIINLYWGNYGLTEDEQLLNFKKNKFSSLSDHRYFWLHHRVMPEWLFSSKKNSQLKFKDLDRFKTTIHQKYNNIQCVGIVSEQALGIGLGIPGKNEFELLKARLISGSLPPYYEEGWADPHPIP